MKKILAFLLALLMLCPAALADVQSETGAPAAYHAVWQSNTGKTIITVDGKKDVADTVVFTLNPDIPLSVFDLEKPWNHEKGVEPK